MGLAFCGSGIWLVALGAQGDTEFSFFGQTFKSADVGIAAVFLGAVTVVLLLRRSLGTVDTIVSREFDWDESGWDERCAELCHPVIPKVTDEQTLKLQLAALSRNQFHILEVIEETPGQEMWALAERVGLDRGSSVVGYRLRDLEMKNLIYRDKDYGLALSPLVQKILGKRKLVNFRKSQNVVP